MQTPEHVYDDTKTEFTAAEILAIEARATGNGVNTALAESLVAMTEATEAQLGLDDATPEEIRAALRATPTAQARMKQALRAAGMSPTGAPARKKTSKPSQKPQTAAQRRRSTVAARSATVNAQHDSEDTQ